MSGYFPDLSDLVTEAPRLTLRIRGTEYRIEDPDAETALWLTDVMTLGERAAAGENVKAAELDDDAERTLYRRALGEDVYAQMLADGIRNAEMKVVLATVITWIKSDEATALRVWEAAARGEAPTPAGNRASRRASEAAARTTQKQGSGTTTKARKTSAAKARPSKKS